MKQHVEVEEESKTRKMLRSALQSTSMRSITSKSSFFIVRIFDKRSVKKQSLFLNKNKSCIIIILTVKDESDNNDVDQMQEKEKKKRTEKRRAFTLIFLLLFWFRFFVSIFLLVSEASFFTFLRRKKLFSLLM